MKKIFRYAALGTLCMSISFALNAKSEATGINLMSEQAVAGITVSLNTYYENTDNNTPVSSTPETNNENEPKVVDQESKEQYENIGIANVEKYLNIRNKPNEKAEIVGKLPKNGGCYIYSIDKNGWAKIKSGKVTGYVLSSYLVMGEEVPALAKKVGSKIATVNYTTVRVREEKSTEATTLTLVPNGEELDVLDDSDSEWVYIMLDNDKGYVSKEYVDIKFQLSKAVPFEDDDAVSASGSGSSTSSVRKRMIAYAKQFLGNQYVWGGTSLTNGTDCSGFTMRVYQKFGYSISRTSRSQASKGKTIKVSAVKPGDLVFYAKSGRINHVAIYIGNGQIIHASNPVSGIKISNLYYKTPYKAVRFINE